MSDNNDQNVESVKKPGKAKKIFFGFLVILLLGGGGAAGGYFAASALGGVETAQEDPDIPKLVTKDGSPVPKKEKALNEKDGGFSQSNESSLKATYYPIEAPFTSNLKNSSSFVQISLAVATYYDERVLENIQEHETAIRSAVLMTTAEQESEALSTQQGKEALQVLLTAAINKVLKQKAGFGGVDNVYFTSFVVQ